MTSDSVNDAWDVFVNSVGMGSRGVLSGESVGGGDELGSDSDVWVAGGEGSAESPDVVKFTEDCEAKGVSEREGSSSPASGFGEMEVIVAVQDIQYDEKAIEYEDNGWKVVSGTLLAV